MNTQTPNMGQPEPKARIRRPIDRPEADIPESEWIVKTNRNRLYLWTYDSEGKGDVELYKRLIREPGIRIEPKSKLLYLDYEMRAKRLRLRDPHADISQKALEAPFIHLVKPDVGLYGQEVELGFMNWLASNQGITLKTMPEIGGKPVRGYFEGDDCVIAQISSYSHQYGGYTCSWVNFKEGNHPQYCNEFNNIGMVKIMDTYQRLQASGLRSRESMARMGLNTSADDPVAEAAKNVPMFFATNEEKMAVLAEEERKRQAQAQREAALNETNIRTLQHYYAKLPPLAALPEDHVGLQYLREKKVLDYVRDIPELRASGVDKIRWIQRDTGQNGTLSIHPGLILPMHNIDGELRNMQSLFYKNNLDDTRYRPNLTDNTRDRRFMSLPSSKLMFAFPGGSPGRADVPIIVVEGFATGASLYAATRKAVNAQGEPVDIPVFVAWDVGNMAKVVPLLHEKYPASPIFIGADNDLKKVHLINSRTGKPYGNPGVEMAEKIRAQYPDTVTVLIPSGNGFPRGVSVDFNDVHVLHGLGRVCEVINPDLQAFGITAHPPTERLAKLAYTDTGVARPNLRDMGKQVQQLLSRSVPLIDMPALPRALQKHLTHGRVLRRDMRWLDSGTELLNTLAEGKIHRVRLGQGILVPLRTLTTQQANIAFYGLEQGLAGKPMHLTDALNGAYYPVSISTDKQDSVPVLLVEDYMDAVKIKQRLFNPYPTIFVAFNAENMQQIAQGIQAIQPQKNLIVIPSAQSNASDETLKSGKSLGDFCKNTQKTIKLLPPLQGEQAIDHAVREILNMRLNHQQSSFTYKPG